MNERPRCAICDLTIFGDHIREGTGTDERIVHPWCLSLEALGLVGELPRLDVPEGADPRPYLPEPKWEPKDDDEAFFLNYPEDNPPDE